MGILVRLALWLSCSKPAPAEPTFAERYAAYQNACVRGDTRAQKDSWQLLKDARTAQLEAERAADIAILNRAIGWRGGR